MPSHHNAKGTRRESIMESSLLNQTRVETLHTHRLSNLKVPKFDGKYGDYKRFIASFNYLGNNEAIPTIDIFNYLLNCLSDQALASVESFQVTEANYEKTLNRLGERFDNKVLTLRDHIISMFEMPCVTKSDATALRTLVDSFSALRGSLFSLGSYK